MKQALKESKQSKNLEYRIAANKWLIDKLGADLEDKDKEKSKDKCKEIDIFVFPKGQADLDAKALATDLISKAQFEIAKLIVLNEKDDSSQE